MRRRKFIKDSWKWTGLLFVPKLLRAQQAFPPSFWSPPAVAAASCTTSVQSNLTSTGSSDIALFGTKALASPFTASQSFTLCKAVLRMKETSNPTGTMAVNIFSDVSGTPTTNLGASSNVNASTLTTSEADVTFTGLSVALTSGTVYWIACVASVTNQSPAKISWATNGASNWIDSSTDNITYVHASFGVTGIYTLYK